MTIAQYSHGEAGCWGGEVRASPLLRIAVYYGTPVIAGGIFFGVEGIHAIESPPPRAARKPRMSHGEVGCWGGEIRASPLLRIIAGGIYSVLKEPMPSRARRPVRPESPEFDFASAAMTIAQFWTAPVLRIIAGGISSVSRLFCFFLRAGGKHIPEPRSSLPRLPR
jgi:hypothetical protein